MPRAPESMTVPEPDERARAHSEQLTATIRDEIESAGGWIAFARYMELALYAPGMGYYSAGSEKLGVAGDFVTAPEISPLFARTLARQAADIITSTSGSIWSSAPAAEDSPRSCCSPSKRWTGCPSTTRFSR